MAIGKNRVPTLVDVAREAGVSLKTASRVLNRSENVREEKKSKILAVMERLGYRPNELARGLKAKKSAAVGMIVPNLSDPFTANAVHGFQEAARGNGYVVILASSGGDVDLERSEVEILVGRQIEGLVIAPADSRTDTFSDIIPPGVHVVTFDQLLRDVDLDSVTVTNRRSAREATKHSGRSWLASNCRDWRQRRLVHLQGTGGWLSRGHEGIFLEPRVCLVEHEQSLTAEWLAEEVFRVQNADAIFTLNWVCTVLVLRALRQMGMVAGRDIPILSFDDFDLADMLTPGLSVVQQPAEMMGREAGRLLVERLAGQGGKSSRAIVLPTTLIIRQSCGCGPDKDSFAPK